MNLIIYYLKKLKMKDTIFFIFVFVIINILLVNFWFIELRILINQIDLIADNLNILMKYINLIWFICLKYFNFDEELWNIIGC